MILCFYCYTVLNSQILITFKFVNSCLSPEFQRTVGHNLTLNFLLSFNQRYQIFKDKKFNLLTSVEAVMV